MRSLTEENLICKMFGHNWNYYKTTADIRVCRCCHRMQEWKHVCGPDKIWSWSIQYRDKGAREHVEGYGKE